ncbi:MAG: glycosyltransferase family 4 protein [Candidatus Pacebacteria bacterium]|nr:glycosyltransferase family 4 protein [Candidatus Paceibacterota bacterium]
MSVAIVTFANLGRKENLKTSDIEPVINSFVKKSELIQIICQINNGFHFPKTASSIPAIVRYPIRLFEKITNLRLSRSHTEILFDFFASLKLKKADVVIFHPAIFERTLHVAQKQESITIGITGVAHPLLAKRLYDEELQRLHLPRIEYSEATAAKNISNQFDYLIAMSPFARQSYIDNGFPEEKIFMAYPDINRGRFAPSEKKDKLFRVVYVGYTTPLKGLHYLLDAWNNAALDNAELILVGGHGEASLALRKQYDEIITADSNIKWVGSTQTPEQYYRDASVFVFPSLTEGFGRVTLEAMACGLPVITTENARGIVEDGKTGFVVPIRDSAALAEKIKYLYNHRDEVAAMGREARKAVENKKPFGEAVYKIYQEILKREHKA